MGRALEPSRRGLLNIQRSHSADFADVLRGQPPYDPDRSPHGLIDLSGASNEMMRDVLADYTKRWSNRLDLSKVLEYGSVAGPEELNEAMADFFNDWFKPAHLIDASNILATNGVSSLIDMVAFNVCDPGDGILLPTPTYSMFEFDLCARAGIAILPVPTLRPEDQFRADFSSEFIKLLEAACDDASRRGIRTKAILLANPSNPLGRFYSRKMLEEIAKFCGHRRLHLIADEIYALSGFKSDQPERLPGFTSVLSLADDPENGVFSENIHSLYGLSKDWAMGGLRLGFFVTRNDKLWKACRRLGLFTWVSHFSTQFWLEFVSNQRNISDYIACNQNRLKTRYRSISSLMDRHNIPYLSANGGLFIWIDLSNWLPYFGSTETHVAIHETRETRLCRYLIQNGVYLTMGESCLSPSPGHFRFVYTSAGNDALVAVERISVACVALDKGSVIPPSMPRAKQVDTVSSEDADSWCSEEAHESPISRTPRRINWRQFLLYDKQ